MSHDLLIAGDFCPQNRLAPVLKSQSGAEIFGAALPLIQAARLSIVNLECPLTSASGGLAKIGPILQADPAAAQVLVEAGFGLATLANNHIMDYGRAGLESTLVHCREAGLTTVGAGFNLEEAESTSFFQLAGKEVAFVNLTENEFSTVQKNGAGAHPLNPLRNWSAIKAAAARARYVVVVFHGGHEMYALPSPRIQQLFRFFADAGACAVVGHHPHVSSGYEYYHGVPLVYSLGNFLFDDPRVQRADWHLGFMVGLDLGERVGLKVYPYAQCRTRPGLQLLEGEELRRFEEDLQRLNSIIADPSALDQAFEAFCGRVARRYRAFLEPLSSTWLGKLQRRKLFPSLLSSNKKRLYQNLLRCESHREVLLRLFQSSRL